MEGYAGARTCFTALSIAPASGLPGPFCHLFRAFAPCGVCEREQPRGFWPAGLFVIMF